MYGLVASGGTNLLLNCSSLRPSIILHALFWPVSVLAKHNHFQASGVDPHLAQTRPLLCLYAFSFLKRHKFSTMWNCTSSNRRLQYYRRRCVSPTSQTWMCWQYQVLSYVLCYFCTAVYDSVLAAICSVSWFFQNCSKFAVRLLTKHITDTTQRFGGSVFFFLKQILSCQQNSGSPAVAGFFEAGWASVSPQQHSTLF